MSQLFHHVSEQEALTTVTRLPYRLAANASRSYSYRGSEGASLQTQARLQQRWYQLFHNLNRRHCQ